MKKLASFFVTPIGDENSDARKRADNVLKHVLEPSIGKKFDITRADKIVEPGSITNSVIEHLINSDLVIADLTELNANVMYEVGIRHSFNLPIVSIAQSGEKLPFDLTQERTHFFDISDLEQVEKAKSNIAKAASSAIKNADDYKGPIHRVMNTMAVKIDEGDLGDALENISDQISNLGDYYSGYGMSSYDSEVSAQVDQLHALFSRIVPYEMDMLIDKLRKL